MNSITHRYCYGHQLACWHPLSPKPGGLRETTGPRDPWTELGGTPSLFVLLSAGQLHVSAILLKISTASTRDVVCWRASTIGCGAPSAGLRIAHGRLLKGDFCERSIVDCAGKSFWANHGVGKARADRRQVGTLGLSMLGFSRSRPEMCRGEGEWARRQTARRVGSTTPAQILQAARRCL